MSESEGMTWAEFERLLGRLTILFSNMDAGATEVLHLLISGADMPVGAILTRRMPLSRKLQYIAKLSAFRLMHLPGLRDRVIEWVARIDEVRPTRNLFIHGRWEYDTQALVSEGKVVVRDLRVEADIEEKQAEWSRGKRTEITVVDLQKLRARVRQFSEEGAELIRTLRATRIASVPWLPIHEEESDSKRE